MRWRGALPFVSQVCTRGGGRSIEVVSAIGVSVTADVWNISQALRVTCCLHHKVLPVVSVQLPTIGVTLREWTVASDSLRE